MLKTVFLLAVLLAGRSNDLVKFGYKDPYLSFLLIDEGLALTPCQLKKQCRLVHFLLEIIIHSYKSDRLLDPVRALVTYKRRTESR